MTVAGISAGVLGGKFDLKFPKKGYRELKGDLILKLGGVDMRVLDLDMDYFMTEIANTPFSWSYLVFYN